MFVVEFSHFSFYLHLSFEFPTLLPLYSLSTELMIFQIYIMFVSDRLPRTPIFLFTSSVTIDKFDPGNIRSLLDRDTIRRLIAQVAGGDQSSDGGEGSGQAGRVTLKIRQASGGLVSLSFRYGVSGARYSYVNRANTYYNAVTDCRSDGGVLACPKNSIQNYIITATQIQ